MVRNRSERREKVEISGGGGSGELPKLAGCSGDKGQMKRNLRYGEIDNKDNIFFKMIYTYIRWHNYHLMYM
jgi:hypothetical protein